MKKLYFFLVALLVSLAANAADWYLVGGSYGWDDKAENKFTDNGDGTYSLTVDRLSGEIKFKEGGTWSTALGSNGSVLKADVPYVAKQGDGNGNIAVDGAIEPANITLTPATKTILVTGATSSVEYAYQIHGNMVGDWTSYDMTEVDGLWVLDNFEFTKATANFGIKKVEADNKSNQVGWIAGAQEYNISASGSYNVTDINPTNFTIAGGKWKFAFDVDNSKLIMTKLDGEQGGEDPQQPEKTTYTILFDNGKTAWDAVNVYVYGAAGHDGGEENHAWPGEAMTLKEGTIYEYTFEAAWTPTNVIFTNADASARVEDVYEADKTYGAPAEQGGEDPQQPEYNVSVRGTFNEWSGTANATTEIVDNCAVITVEVWDAEAEFKVVVNNKWYTTNGAEYNNVTYDGVLENDVWYDNMIQTGEGSNMTLAASAAGKTVTFTVSIDGETPHIMAAWEEDPETLYIYGLFNDKKTPLCEKTYVSIEEFADEEENTYYAANGVLSFVVPEYTTSGFLFGKAEMMVGTEAYTTAAQLENGVAAELVAYAEGDALITLPEDANGKEVVVVVDINAMTVKASWEAEAPTVYIYGLLNYEEYPLCEKTYVSLEEAADEELDAYYAADGILTFEIAEYNTTGFLFGKTEMMVGTEAYSTAAQLENGVAAALVAYDEDLITLPEEANGKAVTITVDVNAMTVKAAWQAAVEPQPELDYYLSGAFTGWGDRKFELVNGTLTTYANCANTDEFGVRAYAEGAADNEKAWYWTAEATTLTETATIQLVQEGVVAGQNPKLAPGYWTITLNPATMQLTATREGDARLEYQLRGLGGNWGTCQTALPNNDNCVVFTVNNWAADDQFKVWYNDGSEHWLGVETSDALQNGEWYTTGGINAKLDASAAGKTVQIVLGLGDMKLQASWDEPEPVSTMVQVDFKAPTSWTACYAYVWGDNDKEAFIEMHVFVPAEEPLRAMSDYTLYTCEQAVDFVPTGILFATTNDWAEGTLQTVDGEFKNGHTYSATGDTDAAGHYEMGEPTQGTTGIEGIAAEAVEAVYYNLQGARIESPAAGQIYIVVRGGNVTKEVIR